MNGPPDHRPVIQFQNVSYRLENGLELLHNLTLQVDRGETLVLLGRSGSGKTTTLKLINHLLSPSAGEVLVDGRSIRDWDLIRLRRMIGYVIQEVGLFPHFTVERNIALVPQLDGWPADGGIREPRLARGAAARNAYRTNGSGAVGYCASSRSICALP